MWQNIAIWGAGFITGAASLYLAAYLFMGYEKKKMEKEIKRLESSIDYKKQMEEAEQILANIMKKRAPLPPPPVVDVSPEVTVKERLRKAVELTSKQLKIDTRKGPEFQLEFNELELRKLDVLRTILADGFDPMITIRYNTGDQEMQLSAYVASIQKGLV